MEFIFSAGGLTLVLLMGWITPGPNMFAIMAASMEHGYRHGLATGLGLAFGAFIWAALAISGVALLFELFPTAVLVLKLVGAVYLIWLGWVSLKTARAASETQLFAKAPRTLNRSILTGLAVSLTNPKAALFFSSIITTFIPVTASGWLLVWVVVYCGILSALLHSITATVFSTPLVLKFFKSAARQISTLFGIVFVVLGGSIILSALRKV